MPGHDRQAPLEILRPEGPGLPAFPVKGSDIAEPVGRCRLTIEPDRPAHPRHLALQRGDGKNPAIPVFELAADFSPVVISHIGGYVGGVTDGQALNQKLASGSSISALCADF